MKYTSSIEIQLPRERVLELLENPENMRSWQAGLKSWRFLDEFQSEAGSRMELVYDMNGRAVTMVETTLEHSLPEKLAFTYEAKGVWNRVENYFGSVGDGATLWRQDNEFRCTGFMGLICLLMPGSFRRETMKSLKQFKSYAEKSQN